MAEAGRIQIGARWHTERIDGDNPFRYVRVTFSEGGQIVRTMDIDEKLVDELPWNDAEVETLLRRLGR